MSKAKKSKKSPSGNPPRYHLARYRRLNQKMLKLLETLLDQPLSMTEAQEKLKQKQHERVCGKMSLAATLVALVELGLKLEETAPAAAGQEQPEAPPLEFSAADAALLENFLGRQRGDL